MERPATDAEDARAEAETRAPAGRAAMRREVRAGAALLAAGFAFAAAGSALLQRAPESPRTQLLAGLSAQMLFLCTAFGVAFLAGQALPRALALGRPRLSALELALVAVGFVCVSHALGLLISLAALRDTGTLAELDRIVTASEGPSRVLAFVAIGLAPAFGEELLFRGLVQQLALPRLGAAGAVVVSSLAFAAVHGDPVQSPAAFGLGLYLGAAALAGASVWTAVLCHGVNNSLSVVMPSFAIALAPGAQVGAAFGLLGAGVVLLGAVAGRARARPSADAPAGGSPGLRDPDAGAPLQREAPPAD
ncbi:MAG TPA: type II CAAX endopeptidase family protein [Myxococcota bacterium]|nr:type II CAAX endopeptidase family protein [Myxococcota bacterium]